MQAYDLFTSRLADDALVDIQLVGDSLANVVLGELPNICWFLTVMEGRTISVS